VVLLGELGALAGEKDRTSIDQATGTSYTGRNNLFPARGMRGQAFPFYTVRQPTSTDYVVIKMTPDNIRAMEGTDMKYSQVKLK